MRLKLKLARFYLSLWCEPLRSLEEALMPGRRPRGESLWRALGPVGIWACKTIAGEIGRRMFMRELSRRPFFDEFWGEGSIEA